MHWHNKLNARRAGKVRAGCELKKEGNIVTSFPLLSRSHVWWSLLCLPLDFFTISFTVILVKHVIAVITFGDNRHGTMWLDHCYCERFALLCFACSCHNCAQSRLHSITIVIKCRSHFITIVIKAGYILSQLCWNAGQLFPSELSVTRNNVSAGVGSSSTLVHRPSHPDNVTAVGSLGMRTARRKMQLELHMK